MQIFLVFAALFGVSSAACGYGWQRYGNKCYKLMANRATWSQQNSACIYAGGALASIKSAAENDAVRRVAGGREIYTGGLSYARRPWSWSDLSPFGYYRNWINGHEPAPVWYKPCIKMDRWGRWFPNCCRSPPAAAVCAKLA